MAGKIVGDKGRILATDILPMESIRNVDFIQGDFTDEAIVQQLLDWLGGGKFDLIISDIAPNITGIDSADQASSIYFLELALDTVTQDAQARRHLRGQDVPGRGIGPVPEAAARALRESADPQARGVAQGIARGLLVAKGFRASRSRGQNLSSARR